MKNNFSTPLEQTAASLLDQLADAVVGKASTLRNGTEHAGVQLPRDLYAHAEAQTEWWYYTGHLRTESNREFGFELVFFKRRTDLDRFGVVPLRLLANPIHFAHFAITDESRGRFRYAHRKSADSQFELPAIAAEDRYFLRLGNWSVREAHGLHLLRATLDAEGSDGKVIFDIALKPTKPVTFNGEHNRGVSFKDAGEASRYFSYTRMAADGHVTFGKTAERVTGSAWMDREFGTWTATENQKGWDWFSIQFGDETELMVYHIRDKQDQPSSFSSGSYVDKEGARTHLSREDFTLEPTGYWRSPHTDAIYPSGWRIRVPRVNVDVTVTPTIKDQELDSRGTTMIVYWEGSARVEGRKEDADIRGRAYVELVGYDRSHENPSITSFLFGGRLDKRIRSIFG